ncbi:MAG: hypothetical protein AVDCRST_MAG85-2400 [uncultured Solirubrobacteraceae bacterium]|uniref:Uncharacterized protein n=1 Tax=uncultured Solirubrobacteraceae bacterium TaxID=1162706 RepID=A0A6J4T2U8_9ACTN|nr:MAG: hypothetical protein AVDCRST_MAG85-2400 [uncultured Solirubrobacteraceae bacterium]
MNPVDFSRLRDPSPTPASELCDCGGSALMLMTMGGFARNPIFCLICEGEVEPTHLGLTQLEVDAVANWRTAYGAVDALELDSRAYEVWAQSELTRVDSPINQEAFELVRILERRRPTYFNFWQGDEVYERCPVGGEPLTAVDGNPGRTVCQRHRIVVLGSRPLRDDLRTRARPVVPHNATDGPRIVACCVRCIVVNDGYLYEERITFWQTNDMDVAQRRALRDAREYADNIGGVALAFTQCYGMDELPDEDAIEVFSLIRQSDLPPHEYIDRYFSTGTEFTQRDNWDA